MRNVATPGFLSFWTTTMTPVFSRAIPTERHVGGSSPSRSAAHVVGPAPQVQRSCAARRRRSFSKLREAEERAAEDVKDHLLGRGYRDRLEVVFWTTKKQHIEPSYVDAFAEWIALSGHPTSVILEPVLLRPGLTPGDIALAASRFFGRMSEKKESNAS